MPEQINAHEYGPETPRGAGDVAAVAQGVCAKVAAGTASAGEFFGLSEAEKSILEKVRKMAENGAGFPLVSKRITAVRHADTGKGESKPDDPILDSERDRARELGRQFREAGYFGTVTAVDSGMERRSAETAVCLIEGLGVPVVRRIAQEINTRSRNVDARGIGEGRTFMSSVQCALDSMRELAPGKTAVMVLHRANWGGFVRALALNTKAPCTVSTRDVEPLEFLDFDFPENAPEPCPEILEHRHSVDHDAAGTIRVGADDFEQIRGALENRHAGLVDATTRVRKGALGIVDFQNLLNATLVLAPEFTKSLAGCGVPELDLMALRTAMGVRPYTGAGFDGEAAAKAFAALAKTNSIGIAASALEAAENTGAAGKLATLVVRDETILKAVRETAKGTKNGGLASFAAVLEVAATADAAFCRSMDWRISGARAENPADWPLGGTYHPVFHVLNSDGNEIYNDTASSSADGARLLESLVSERPGVTVVEADGGSGKSMLLAQAVRGGLTGGKNGLGKVAYMDLAAKQIDEKGEIPAVRDAVATAEVILLDSLDEAKWADANNPEKLEEKRKKLSAWIQNLALEGKRIVLTARPGHWAGGGRRLRLSAFDTTKADAFVREYLAGHARKSALMPGWETLRGAAENDAALAEIVGNPLTLLLLCDVVANDAEFDETKTFSWYAGNTGRLFEDTARKRLERWECGEGKTRNGEVPTEAKERTERLMAALGQIAYMMGAGWGVTEKNVLESLPDNVRGDAVRLLKNANGERSYDVGPLGLLVQRNESGEVTFAQERMREYFSARHARRLVEMGIDVPTTALPGGKISLDNVPDFGDPESYRDWKENIFAPQNFHALSRTGFVREVILVAEKAGLDGSKLSSILISAAAHGGPAVAAECIRAMENVTTKDDLLMWFLERKKEGDGTGDSAEKGLVATAKKTAVVQLLSAMKELTRDDKPGAATGTGLNVEEERLKPKNRRLIQILVAAAGCGNPEATLEIIQKAEAKKELLGGMILTRILAKAGRCGGAEAAAEAISAAERSELGDEGLAVVLEAAAGCGNPEATLWVIQKAEARKDRMEKKTLARILSNAGRHGGAEAATEAISAAERTGLGGETVAEILEMLDAATAPHETRKSFLTHGKALAMPRRLSLAETYLSGWLAHHGIFLARYTDDNDDVPHRLNKLLSLLGRFRLRDPNEHRELIRILKSP